METKQIRPPFFNPQKSTEKFFCNAYFQNKNPHRRKPASNKNQLSYEGHFLRSKNLGKKFFDDAYFRGVISIRGKRGKNKGVTF